MELLKSKAIMTHNKCGNSYEVEDIFTNTKCPHCEDTTGSYEYKYLDGNCAKCENFITNTMLYPSGKCNKHNINCGEGFYCEDISVR